MDASEIIRRLRMEATKRLAKTAAYFAGECKKVLSVPAPRKVSKRTGKAYATTRATPGAPPRKVTGRGRASVSWKLEPGGMTAIVGTNVFYMGVHERGGHPWLIPTLHRERATLNLILSGGTP